MIPVLRLVQDDFFRRAEAAEAFASTAVIEQHRALTEAQIAEQLKTLRGRSGKVGTCLLVQMPELTIDSPDLPGPRVAVGMSLVAIEHPSINASSLGSGVSAEELAVAGLQLFHHFVSGGLCFVGERVTPENGLAGLVAYTVTFTGLLQLAPLPKVARPTIALAGGNATLACATAGAAIRYTLDGSPPFAGNPAALLYAAPFAVAAGTQLRAAASLATYQQSDIATATAS